MTTMWGAPLHKRWRGSRLRDPRQARFLTLASLKWVIANKAYTPWYLVRYWRLLKFRLANPHIILRGMVFLGKNVEIHCRPGYGRMEIGRWVHIGDFDHVTADITRPIKDQGIVKAPVRIGPDTWIGTKVSLLRGTRIGRGCVLGAHAVVRGD